MSIRMRTITIALTVLGLALLPGCILAAIGVGAGVVAVTSEDSARVDLRAEPDAVFRRAVELVEEQGTVTSTDDRNLSLSGEVDGSSVEIRVFRVNEFTRVTVEARKLGGTLPNRDLAELLATDLTHSF